MEKPKKTKSGKWRVRAAYYDGKERRFKSFTADKKADVIIMAREFEQEADNRGSYADLTLSQAYNRYAEAKKNALSPRTYSEYSRANKRDFPELMNIKLKELTPEIIQTAVSEAAAVLASKTVRNRHGHLSAVLKMYYPQIKLDTTLPQPVEPDIYIPTSEEINFVLMNASERLRVPVLLASSGSLRRSEIAAITPDDVTDFGVHVNKAAVYNKDKKLVIKQPKTKAGARFCPLPPDVVKQVKAWSGYGITPNALNDLWQKFKEKHGIEYKFHAFRHYFASELHAQGIPDQYIIRVGGWKNASTLQRIYQHTLRDKEKIYDKKIVEIFTKELTNKQSSKIG